MAPAPDRSESDISIQLPTHADLSSADDEGTVIPRLVEGTDLAGEFTGSGYREPPLLVSRPDGQVVNLPPVLYRLAQLMEQQREPGQQPRDRDQALEQLAEVIGRDTGRDFQTEHIEYLLDTKLAPLGVTTYSDGSDPTLAKAKPMLALRFRTAVFPAEVTWALGGLFAWLYRPVALVLGIAGAVAAEIWAFATQDMSGALQEVLVIPAGVALVILLSVTSTAFHEFGHAAACRYGGVAPGTMGCGVYIVWPVFYTDVTSAYRLGRAGRLRTDLGGVYFNGVFVIGLVSLYAWTGMAPFLVAILATNLEMIRQLLPTLRFDGYYIVADLVGIPDLFKFIGPIFRRVILRGPPDSRLQVLKTWPQRFVAAWVLIVVPVLLAQLTYLAILMPTFLGTAWQRATTISSDLASGQLNAVNVAVSSFHIVMLVIPVAGLFVIIGLLTRAGIRAARRRPSRPRPRHALPRGAPRPAVHAASVAHTARPRRPASSRHAAPRSRAARAGHRKVPAHHR